MKSIITIKQVGSKIEASVFWNDLKYLSIADKDAYDSKELVRNALINACKGRVYVELAKEQGRKWDAEFQDELGDIFEINNEYSGLK